MISIREKKRKNGTSLYLDINFKGVRKWVPLNLILTGKKSIDNETMLQAEKIRAKYLLDLSSERFDIEQVLSGNKDFIVYYKKIIDENPEYERRVSVYKHLCKYCELNFIEKLYFKDINESFWEKFRKYLITEAELAQSTIHLTLRHIKSALNRAVREKIILSNPLQFIKEKKPVGTRTYLTFDELKLLKDTPCNNEAVKNAFFFSCYTGLRLGDVEKLRKKDFINNELIIKMKKTGDNISNPVDGKIDSFVNLDGKSDEDLVFNLPARSIINTTIHSWTKAAGIKKNVSYHTSRHTFATMILTYGGSLEAVKELLGHKDIRETQIYAKLIDEKKREAIKNLPEL